MTSIVDEQLALLLRLDSISDTNTVIDSSGNDDNGIVNGAPQAVPDELFGSALDFGGSADYIEVARDPFGASADFSISLWVKPAALDDGATHGIAGKQGDAYARPSLWQAAANGGLTYDSYDPSGQRFTGTLASFFEQADRWVNLAWVKRGTDYAFYRDGQLFASQPAPARIYSAGGSYWAGKVDTFWAGRLANLRVYTRALSDAEVWENYRDDPSAYSSFRALFPLDFMFFNDEGNATLFLDDSPSGQTMHLSVLNTSRQTIQLAAGTGSVSESNYHLNLLFRPGTLNPSSLGSLDIAESGWSHMLETHDDQTVSLYLLSAQALALDPRDSLTLTLQHVQPAAGSGARITQVALYYQQMTYAGDPTVLSGSRLQQLNVINHQGQRSLPLHVSFIDGNTILNDGGSANSLTLGLTNLLDSPLSFNLAASESPSKFILSFDVDQSWALGTLDEVKAIVPAIAGWTTQPNFDGESAEWIFTSASQSTLAAGATMQLTLSTIVSSLPNGQANLYLSYENIPGYWDGQVVATLVKTPLVLEGRKVGVGTSAPSRPLSIRAQGTPQELLAFESLDGTTKWHVNQNVNGNMPGLNFAETGVLDGRLFLQPGGNVGLSTTTPRSRLDMGNGLLSGAANDYAKAQWTMSGGGTVSWGGPGGRLKWTARFIAISAERPSTFAEGFVDIVMPTSPIPAAQVYNGQARAADASGVQLNIWEALYAVHTVGGGRAAVTYQIASYTNPRFYTPSNWILVAVVNGDDSSIKLGTGVTLSARSASSRGSPIPNGTIIMWSGAIDQVPDGWALCNGQPGTPNLLDRFIVGAGASYGVGNTGGAAQVALSDAQMPNHVHGVNIAPAGRHRHKVFYDTGGGGNQEQRGDMAKVDHGKQENVDPNFAAPTDAQEDHVHGVSINGAGGNQPHENRPPYYALAFLIKI